MPLDTLLNAVTHWASRAFSTKEATADAKAAADAAQATADEAQAMAGVVVVTLTEAEDGTVAADMTVDEAAELVRGGRRVTVSLPDGSKNIEITNAGQSSTGRAVVTGGYVYQARSISVYGYAAADGDTWTVFYNDLAQSSDLTSLSTRVDALEGAGGGGAGPLIVGLNGGALDTPFADVLAALQAGQAVELRGDILTGLTDVLHVVAFGSGSITFSGLFIGANDSSVDVIFVVLNKDESVAAMPYTIAANPLT